MPTCRGINYSWCCSSRPFLILMHADLSWDQLQLMLFFQTFPHPHACRPVMWSTTVDVVLPDLSSSSCMPTCCGINYSWWCSSRPFLILMHADLSCDQLQLMLFFQTFPHPHACRPVVGSTTVDVVLPDLSSSSCMPTCHVINYRCCSSRPFLILMHADLSWDQLQLMLFFQTFPHPHACRPVVGSTTDVVLPDLSSSSCMPTCRGINYSWCCSSRPFLILMHADLSWDQLQLMLFFQTFPHPHACRPVMWSTTVDVVLPDLSSSSCMPTCCGINYSWWCSSRPFLILMHADLSCDQLQLMLFFQTFPHPHACRPVVGSTTVDVVLPDLSSSSCMPTCHVINYRCCSSRPFLILMHADLSWDQLQLMLFFQTFPHPHACRPVVGSTTDVVLPDLSSSSCMPTCRGINYRWCSSRPFLILMHADLPWDQLQMMFFQTFPHPHACRPAVGSTTVDVVLPDLSSSSCMPTCRGINYSWCCSSRPFLILMHSDLSCDQLQLMLFFQTFPHPHACRPVMGSTTVDVVLPDLSSSSCMPTCHGINYSWCCSSRPFLILMHANLLWDQLQMMFLQTIPHPHACQPVVGSTTVDIVLPDLSSSSCMPTCRGINYRWCSSRPFLILMHANLLWDQLQLMLFFQTFPHPHACRPVVGSTTDDVPPDHSSSSCMPTCCGINYSWYCSSRPFLILMHADLSWDQLQMMFFQTFPHPHACRPVVGSTTVDVVLPDLSSSSCMPTCRGINYSWYCSSRPFLILMHTDLSWDQLQLMLFFQTFPHPHACQPVVGSTTVDVVLPDLSSSSCMPTCRGINYSWWCSSRSFLILMHADLSWDQLQLMMFLQTFPHPHACRPVVGSTTVDVVLPDLSSSSCMPTCRGINYSWWCLVQRPLTSFA